MGHCEVGVPGNTTNMVVALCAKFEPPALTCYAEGGILIRAGFSHHCSNVHTSFSELQGRQIWSISLSNLPEACLTR